MMRIEITHARTGRSMKVCETIGYRDEVGGDAALDALFDSLLASTGRTV
jgi:hypothetical protein